MNQRTEVVNVEDDAAEFYRDKGIAGLTGLSTVAFTCVAFVCPPQYALVCFLLAIGCLITTAVTILDSRVQLRIDGDGVSRFQTTVRWADVTETAVIEVTEGMRVLYYLRLLCQDGVKVDFEVSRLNEAPATIFEVAACFLSSSRQTQDIRTGPISDSRSIFI